MTAHRPSPRPRKTAPHAGSVPPAEQPALERALQMTINGIAAGMRNTG